MPTKPLYDPKDMVVVAKQSWQKRLLGYTVRLGDTQMPRVVAEVLQAPYTEIAAPDGGQEGSQEAAGATPATANEEDAPKENDDSTPSSARIGSGGAMAGDARRDEATKLPQEQQQGQPDEELLSDSLPASFPSFTKLLSAGLFTYQALEIFVSTTPLDSLVGIGPSSAVKIRQELTDWRDSQ